MKPTAQLLKLEQVPQMVNLLFDRTFNWPFFGPFVLKFKQCDGSKLMVLLFIMHLSARKGGGGGGGKEVELWLKVCF